MTRKKDNPPRVRRGSNASAVADAHRSFVDAYLTNGGNATNAAIQSGYSPRSAHVQGCRMLKEAKDSGALENRRKEVNRALDLDKNATLRQARAIEQATLNVFMNHKGKLLPPGEWPAEWRGAVQSYEMTRYGPKIKLHEKSSAAGLLAKYHGLVNAELERRIAALEERLKEK